jgi:hypothetical protein
MPPLQRAPTSSAGSCIPRLRSLIFGLTQYGNVDGRTRFSCVSKKKFRARTSHRTQLVFGLLAATLTLPVLAYAQGSGSPELTAQVDVLQTQVKALQTQITALQNQLAAAKPVLALAPFVSIDPNPENGVRGPNIIFTGANIHIVSGLGATNDDGNPSGLGNLILGYNEPPGTGLNPGDRGGSHNLVLGRFNRFSSSAFGGLVAGEDNVISNAAATVTGGNLNAASGLDAAVTGGQSNTASGVFTAVTGGKANLAEGFFCVVTGGYGNDARGIFSSITGGGSNTTNGGTSTICGGTSNVTYSGADSILGGSGNTTSGFTSVVLGGQNNSDDTTGWAIVPQPPFP